MEIMPLPSPCKPWQGAQKILYRSSPRSRRSRFTGSGKLFESLGTMRSSSAMEPRATVFSTGGLSERPSSKKLEGESGRFFGCVAMSWTRFWHPPAAIKRAAEHVADRRREPLIIGHLVHMVRVKAVERSEERRVGKECRSRWSPY